MNWLQGNPVGAALLGACGLLVVIGLGLTLLWGGPADSGADLAGSDEALGVPEVAQVEELGPLRNYEVINNRPVFNPSRRPEVIEVDGPEEEPELVVEQEIAERPKVRLTGVVITPTERVVTLTPEAGGEAVVIREGKPLEGEFVGWTVDEVNPRRVSLLSARGDQFNVELAVHDAMIAEPPEPEPLGDVEALAEDGEVPEETRSRADEIRERIRQRREELREEAEQEQADEEGRKASTQSAYQDAIRSMINRNSSAQKEAAKDDEAGDQ